MENQPKLICEKQTVTVIEASDLDNFVKEVYGQYFSFVVDQEARNDSTHSFPRIGEPLHEYHEKDLKEFIETGEHDHLARTLLNDLCRKGLIEAGKYVVNVCW